MPVGLSDEEESKDEESKKVNNRQTEAVPKNFDESLFLDKIKEFNPNESELPEIAEDEPAAEFDITQVE